MSNTHNTDSDDEGTSNDRGRIRAAARAEGMSQWGKPLPARAVQTLRIIAESITESTTAAA